MTGSGKTELAIALIEEQLAAVDPARFTERTLFPARTDVKVLRYDVVRVW